MNISNPFLHAKRVTEEDILRRMASGEPYTLEEAQRVDSGFEPKGVWRGDEGNTEDVWPTGEGRKDDCGKLPWHLLPFDVVRGVVRILKFGAVKYEARNWEKGMEWDRCFSAAMRHMTAWWEGENKDEETGESHLLHALCCLLFLAAFEIRGVGRDTRPGGPK